MRVDGECHCGAVAYEAEVNEKRTFICHCEDCQIFSGSAFRVRSLVERQDFTLTRGDLKTYTKIAASGNQRVMHFCETCGTHICGTDHKDLDGASAVSISTGTMQQKARVTPIAQVWCGSKLPWVAEMETMPQVVKQRLD